MTEEEINGLINQVKIMMTNTVELKRQELLKMDSISFLHWIKTIRLYLETYKAISGTPQLVEFGDTLLNMHVELDDNRQEELYKYTCKIIKRINSLKDYGSFGAATI